MPIASSTAATATVIPFPGRSAPRHPQDPAKFTKTARSVLSALEYAVPGLEIEYDACDDGDEWAALMPPDGGPAEFTVFPAAGKLVLMREFSEIGRYDTPAELRAVLKPRLAALAACWAA